MIQYRLANPGLRPDEAAACEHPALADLRRHGPWQVQVEPDAVVLTQAVPGWQPEGWGEWQDAAVAGRRFRLATNPPGLHLLRRPRLARLPWQTVELACGDSIRIPAAMADGCTFGVDGTPGRIASRYGRALVDLLDRSARGESPPPSDWLAAITLAIQAGHRLTDDAIRAMDLVAHTDLDAYLQAMTHAPKADPASAG